MALAGESNVHSTWQEGYREGSVREDETSDGERGGGTAFTTEIERRPNFEGEGEGEEDWAEETPPDTYQLRTSQRV